jgi:hypothetical protein
MLIATSLALLLALPPADFEGPPPPAGEIAGAVTRLVAYKNGVSLVSVHLSGTAGSDGRLRHTLPAQQLVLGSVWLAGESAPLAVRAATSTEEALRPVEGLRELLETNRGREVTVTWLPARVATWPESGLPSFTGTIDRLFGTTAVPFAGAQAGSPTHVVLAPSGSRIFPSGSQVVAIDDIVSINGTELRTEIVDEVVRDWALEFEVEPGAAFSCDLHYLARGFAWRAIHRLEGDLVGEEAHTFAVELSNDLVDLDGASVHVVAGEPNFRSGDLASFLSAVATSAAADAGQMWSQQVASNAFFGNSNAYLGRSEPGTPEAGGAVGSAEGDLTRIAVGAVTLERGGRALHRIAQHAVPIRHVYTLDLDVRRGSLNGVEVRDARAPGASWEPAYKGGFVRARRSKVWHQLALENTSDVPWTSGPLLVVKSEPDGPFPLAQEDLRYTPTCGSAEVPLNLALDVDLEFHEEAQGDDNDAVTGFLSLTNRVGERIELRARIGLGGRVSIVEGEAAVFASPGRDDDWTGEEQSYWRFWRDSNPHSEIEWKIAIEPGATVTLRYVSTYDVRRR